MEENISHEDRETYRKEQRETVLKIVRNYNPSCPIVQNFDIGHTYPQMPLPHGRKTMLDSQDKKIFCEF